MNTERASQPEITPRLSVVVPAYNEESRLPATLERMLQYLDAQDEPAEIIIVDDGSVDRTVELVRPIANEHPSVCIILNDHRGKGYAVRTGVLAAQGDFILFSDADMATPIEEWEKLRGPLEDRYDVAIGSREGLGAQRLGEPWYRHLMGRVFNYLVRFVATSDFQDTQCGFKAFQREVAHDLFRRVQLYGEEAKQVKGAALTGFDVEVLFLAQKRGYKIKEVPVVWHYDALSKVSPLRESVRMFRDVCFVRWNDLRGRYGG